MQQEIQSPPLADWGPWGRGRTCKIKLHFMFWRAETQNTTTLHIFNLKFKNNDRGMCSIRHLERKLQTLTQNITSILFKFQGSRVNLLFNQHQVQSSFNLFLLNKVSNVNVLFSRWNTTIDILLLGCCTRFPCTLIK